MAHKVLLDSFERVSAHGNQFYDAFYREFIQANKEVASFFKGTDFNRQYMMLSKSLSYIVLNSSTDTIDMHSAEMVRNIIAKHNLELKIPRHLYGVWKEALIKALARYDEQFNNEVERYWREAIDIFVLPFGSSEA